MKKNAWKLILINQLVYFLIEEAIFEIMSDDEFKIENISNKLKSLASSYILQETISNDTIKSLKNDKVVFIKG